MSAPAAAESKSASFSGDTPKDTVAIYTNLKKHKSMVWVVFFRGHWCPFCMAYLTELETIRNEVYARGGAIMVVTAESETLLEPVRSVYKGYIFSDPAHKLADHLAASDLISIAKTPKDGYPNGMAQPGVLVVRGAGAGSGSQEGEKLYGWAIVPSLMNLGGAKDRPSLPQIRDNVFAQMDGKTKDEVPHKVISTMTFWQGIRFKIFGGGKKDSETAEGS